jgi:hypothetical protein
MSSERGGVPEAPTDVSAQPSLNGGAFVFWRPVRLDDRDRNNGCKVAGYGVYVDGVQRTKVNEPFGSHVEMDGLENGAQYQIQVRCVYECVCVWWVPGLYVGLASFTEAAKS